MIFSSQESQQSSSILVIHLNNVRSSGFDYNYLDKVLMEIVKITRWPAFFCFSRRNPPPISSYPILPSKSLLLNPRDQQKTNHKGRNSSPSASYHVTGQRPITRAESGETRQYSPLYGCCELWYCAGPTDGADGLSAEYSGMGARSVIPSALVSHLRGSR